jgi:uncharacterized membrane protein
MSSRLLGLVVLTGLAASGPVAAQQIVTLPVGSVARDVTPDGEVVVGAYGFGGGFIWRWRVDPAPTVILDGEFTGISDDGTVACGNLLVGSNDGTAGIWTAATGLQSIGYLPGSVPGCGGGLSSAYDISGDGTTIVGLSWGDNCSGLGFRWTAATGMQPLQSLANGHNRCSSITGDGSLLAGFAQGTSTRTPAFWNPDTSGFVIDPNLMGEVYRCTEDGSQSVGTLYFSGSLFTAFVRDTQSGVFTNLHQLQSGWAAAASDLSEDGSVIVGFDYISLSRKAWVWTDVDGMIGLKERLTALGVANVPDLATCLAVSNDGTVVVGMATLAGGPFGSGAFIAELPRPTSQWTNLAGGLAGTAGIPKLVGNGTLVAHTSAGVVLTQGKPFAPAALVVGLSAANLPFKQGVLVPNPNFIFPLASLSGQGAVALHFTWPGGVPSGFAMYWQFLISDRIAPAGVSLSNALNSLTP